ncbi:helicase-related protein [Pseudoxanthobacter sp. M-2]|uniref:helicase-related protein n=1 Tax=Pseudoxanthobacter sp. M-2 TaxID=3078754 RepID=UPI0038FBF00E
MNVESRSASASVVRSRSVTAVLGPTNTGKTHLAIERMIAHGSGLIGLPLRLLAREVYNRVAARVGADAVALVTGEERIVPPAPRFTVCTVEAMPRDADVSFLAVDEVQLAGDLERGRVFTDRILNSRGRDETLLLGATTVRPMLEKLIPGLNVVTRPRMSVLAYAGSKKITRLPARSAIVAFSADEVYAIAELIRRQRGGAAVVLGSLSPRTRNAQVELFQAGDVEFLVATDAIGMGLNLDVDHVAFAGDRKFDGYQYRALNAAELGQIAGRAGRHMRDGTFGVTGRVAPFDNEMVEALESHRFQSLRVLQWRNPDLDFASLDALRRSLDEPPRQEGLTRAPQAEDSVSLDYAARDPDIRALASTRARVSLLWDVCQVPDYRRIAPANHADLVLALYGFIARSGRIPDDWFARQVDQSDRTDGDIDALSNRIAHVRTWTYVANRGDWLADPAHWRGVTRDVEDRLSDALHERLTRRFVDRRTSVLMKRLRENAMLEAEITPAGDVSVEGQHVGRLAGFRFVADTGGGGGDGPEVKALRSAAAKALAGEIDARADRLGRAADSDLVLAADGAIRWLGEPVAKLIPGDDVLTPGFVVLADDQLTGASREKVQTRLGTWLKTQVETLLKPLIDLRNATELPGLPRGIAFRIAEALGVVERPAIAEDIKGLDQAARAGLRSLGVRFGAYHLFVPALLKPAPSRLLAELWALKHASLDVPGLLEVPQLSASGRTSIPVDPAVPVDLYRVCGFKACGGRAVRIDILERLADLIRPILAWRPGPEAGPMPDGAHPAGGFMATVRMTSLVGCSGEDFASILRGLGYRMDRRPLPVRAPETPAATPSTADAAVAPEAVDADAATAATFDTAATEAETATPDDVGTEAADAIEASATPEQDREPPVATESAEGPVAEAAEAAEGDGDLSEAAQMEAASEEFEPKVEPDDATTSTEAVAAPVDTAVEVPASEATSASEVTDASEETAAAADVAVSEETTSAEAVASAEAAAVSETSDGEPVAADAAAEPVLVEVWRPGRPERRGEPRHRGNRDRQADRSGERRGDRGPRRAENAPAATGAPGEAPAAGEARPDRRPDRPRGDDRRGRPPQGQGRPAEGRSGGRPGGDRPEGQRARDDRPRGDRPRDDRPREDRPRNDRPREDRPRDDRPRDTGRGRQPDPNSPFAALAALKADLERRAKER